MVAFSGHRVGLCSGRAARSVGPPSEAARGRSGLAAIDHLTGPSTDLDDPTYSGPTVCFRPGSSSRAVASVERASATTDRVDAGSITASTNPRSEAW